MEIKYKQVECLKCGRVFELRKHVPLKLSWCKFCKSSKLRIYKRSGKDQRAPDSDEDFIQIKQGYCYYEIKPPEHPIIYNLFVHPQYRGHGFGRKLVCMVIDIIRQTGYAGEIDIEVAPKEKSIDPERLKDFYEEMGLNVITGKDG